MYIFIFYEMRQLSSRHRCLGRSQKIRAEVSCQAYVSEQQGLHESRAQLLKTATF